MFVPEIDCPRKLKTCKPLDAILMEDDGFICCGRNDGSERSVPQDVYTVCWKNAEIDERSHWDEQDILSTIKVLSSGLVIDRLTDE